MSNRAAGETVVRHSETAKRGVFHIGEIARMTYTRPSANVMKVDHTVVDKAHRLQGLAHRMYRAMVAFAREDNRKVIAVCPFVVAMFEQNPPDRDVLHS